MVSRDIKYLDRDFDSLKRQLIEFSKTYFPNTYNNFSPSSLGVMFMEQASYVGDVLSFYLDNQIQENFIQYARQNNNLYDLAYMFSYKPKVTSLSTTNINIYQLLPAKLVSGSYLPDYDYSLTIPQNTQVSSNRGVNFLLENPVDFSVSSSIDPTVITIAQTFDNNPTYFLAKKTRKISSGNIITQNLTFGGYEEFPTRTINDSNISHIIDVVDQDGNVWYEVDSLGQELVYDSIKNTNINDPNNFVNSNDTPYILKTKQTQRRFTTRFINNTSLQIQFGSGNNLNVDEEKIPNPQNVGVGLRNENERLTTAFSPTNFIFTNTYGVAPVNTVLTVRYLKGGGVSSNIPSNSISSIDSSNIKYLKNNLNSSTADFIFNSLAVSNPEAAEGGGDGDSINEIRQNALSNFNSQLRNVTPNDYLVRTLSMPSKYGSIAKALVQKPKIKENDSTLDIYVLTYDINKKLKPVSSSLKTNLKTYLNQYRMIGDNLNIKNAFIVNIGVDFEIITLPEFNSNEVVLECISALKDYFNIDNWQVNQPIILRDIYILLDRIKGVQTVNNINIYNKSGDINNYSNVVYDIKGATQNNIIYPPLDPSIFEVKFPNTDIRGKSVLF